MTSRLNAIAGRGRNLAEHEVVARFRRARIDPSAVFLESFAGNGMLCNPEALFRTLLTAPDLAHLRFVWALSGDGHAATRAQFAGEPRVSFVHRRSVPYYRELGRARYLVNNATFPVAFAKRAEQVFLATWHGTPLKAMGYDMPGGALESANVVRNLVAADYLLAPNEQTASMYLDAYRLHDVWRGQLLRAGTPRIDRQFATGAERTDIRARLRHDGVALSETGRVVLYAPTWRGTFATPDRDHDRLCADLATLRRQLGAESDILVKVHQRVYAHAASDPRLAGTLVPNAVPTNDVLAVTDVLVSDYSSILVDFLATGRPVIRYVPDFEDYVANRGLTVDPAALPGPLCRTLKDVFDALGSDLTQQACSAEYVHARETYCGLEDGHASHRVIDAVFRAPHRTRPAIQHRRSVLIYLGGMRTNGITTAALSLLRKLDYERLDITVTFPAPHSVETENNAALIDPRARQLPRLGRLTWTQVRATPFPVVGGRSPFVEELLLQERRLHDEWRRCFGDLRFDHVVNFAGYSAFFTKLLRCAPSGMSAIWLHNDMRAEMVSPRRGAWLRANVRRTTSLYVTADSLVSVSPALEDVNRRGCATLAQARHFGHARNTVDAARIRELAGPTGRARGLPASENAPGTFVTVGRLSAEKNHLRLLRAFASVHHDDPHTRLVIVGGGHLDADLRVETQRLGIADAVVFTGSVENPFVLMAKADCFVMSSDYEGQPMVLLEALVLGLPIVTTDFESVGGALPVGSGLVVSRDVGALAEGMRAFLRGEVPSSAFDDDAYNAEAVAEFYRAIGVPNSVLQ
ncbi:CDP-glycerol glycerophosphotransferase family protein [uncultured Jatrophihabitans sp.]|uniref:CDP-glycerol glycerophosphotransferase family protein n=1 Tax=uncultured Jatrophihabitans sp. TaxID=1610747 RepID=UPI0035CB74BB